MVQLVPTAKYASNYQLEQYHNIGYENPTAFLAINSCGIYDETVPSQIISRLEGRQDYYLTYNETGHMTVKTNQGIVEVKEGEILLYRPEEQQVYWYKKKEYAKNYWIHFTGYGAKELLETHNLQSSIPYPVGYTPSVATLFEAIIHEINNRQVFFETFTVSMFLQILGIFSRKIKEDIPKKISLRNEQIYETICYIQTNFAENLLVSRLAKIACMSGNQYASVFKSLLGVTPKQYILNYKLQKARELLRITDLSIGEIALAIGYEDRLYFSRLFKQHTSVTPTEFRERLQQR